MLGNMGTTTDVPSLQFHMDRIPLKIQVTHGIDNSDAIYSVHEVTHSNDALRLPPKLIIKQQIQYVEMDLLTNEGLMYSKLAHLQGNVVPIYHGIFEFHHEGKSVRAHVIEKIEGKPLCHYTQEDWNTFDIKKKITRAVDKLSQAGVIHGDLRMRNVFVTEPQKDLRLIDLDQAVFLEDEGEAMAQNNVDMRVLFDECDW
jgi:serine/threonine protein kinase